MIWLVLGVAIWSAVHFIPSLGQTFKGRLIESFGENSYKAGFSIIVVASIVLMVLGWRSTPPLAIYKPAEWTGPLTNLLMVLAFLLFGASKHQTAIKRVVRHPQLTGFIVWAVAHLISNGDGRSLVLFGGLGIWALLEIFFINAREGEWKKPQRPSLGIELRGHAISLAIFAVVMFLHPYFAGVSPIPR